MSLSQRCATRNDSRGRHFAAHVWANSATTKERCNGVRCAPNCLEMWYL